YLMGQIAVCEDHEVHVVLVDQFFDFGFGMDLDPVGIEAASQFGGVFLIIDAGNLSGGEGHNFIILIVAEEDVEIVKITSCRTHDDYSAFHSLLLDFYISISYRADFGQGSLSQGKN